MKKGIVLWAALCMAVGLFSSAMAAGDNPPVLAPGETAIVRVYYPNQAMGNKIFISFEAQMLETDAGNGYHVMRVTREDVDRLTAAGLRVVLDETWKPKQPEMRINEKEDEGGIPGYPCYRTVEETFATAESLAEQYPDIAEWIDVGDSWDKDAGIGGFDMRVLRLTNEAIQADKPVLFLTAAMHAREYATAELVTRYAEYLVTNYGSDPDVTWILDHHEIHLMLQTNPDGRKIAEDHTFWRKNTNADYCLADADSRGADLNRNYSFEWDCCGGSSDDDCSSVYHGPFHASEPEIQAVQAYMGEIFPVQRPEYDPEYDPNDPPVFDLDTPAPDDATGIYIDVHSYSRLVLWPWGSTGDLAPNHTQLQTLGRKFAYWNDYSPEQAIGLYPTDGTSDEHAYGTFGVAAYCFEIGTSFFQPCQTFESTVLPDNLPALLYAAKVVRTPYLTPAGPDATDLSAGGAPVYAGQTVALTATIDDTRYKKLKGNVDNEPVQAIAAGEYYVDTPPWSGGVPASMTAADGGFDSPVEVVTANVATGDLTVGKHIVFVRGQDALGNWGAFSAVFVEVTE